MTSNDIILIIDPLWIAIGSWVDKGTEYRWYLDELIQWILGAEFEQDEAQSLFERLEKAVRASRVPNDEQAKMLQRLDRARERHAA